jgi:hypothetical protein
MPDPFLSDRVNSLAQSLVKELESILADQDPKATSDMIAQLGGPHYVYYLAIRPILTGVPWPSALFALMATMAEILVLCNNSWDNVHSAAESYSKMFLQDFLRPAWDTKMRRMS